MNHCSKVFAMASALIIIGVAATPGRAQEAPLVGAANPAAATCAGEAGLSNEQRRIVVHADAGFASLRGFVLRTRMIYRLDVREAAAWLDRYRAANALCGQRMARVDPIAVAP